MSSASTLILSKTIHVTVEIDRSELLRILFASPLMATVVTSLQHFLSCSLLMPACVLIGGVAYVALIRVLVALSDEDYELLHQLLGVKAARYATRILGFSHSKL